MAVVIVEDEVSGFCGFADLQICGGADLRIFGFAPQSFVFLRPPFVFLSFLGLPLAPFCSPLAPLGFLCCSLWRSLAPSGPLGFPRALLVLFCSPWVPFGSCGSHGVWLSLWSLRCRIASSIFTFIGVVFFVVRLCKAMPT